MHEAFFHSLEIDVTEPYLKLLKENYDENYALAKPLMQNPKVVDEVIEIFTERYTPKEVNEDPGSYFDNDEMKVIFCLQELKSYPGKGIPLIHKAIRSSEPPVRNMVLRVLEAWIEKKALVTLSKEIESWLSEKYNNETDEKERKRIDRILHNESFYYLNIIHCIWEDISNSIKSDDTDWNLVEKKIINNKDHINDISLEDEDTILSGLALDINVLDVSAPILHRTIMLFLKHGYDFNANNRLNGTLVLRTIVNTAYNLDPYYPRVVKFLLENGVKIQAELGEVKIDAFERIRDDIDTRYVSYDVCENANYCETYIEQVNARDSGEPYSMIDSYELCLNGKLQKVEKLSFDTRVMFRDMSERNGFLERIVMWIDDTPLVISNDLLFVVNPYIIEKAIKRTDISDTFSQLIGLRLKEFCFIHRFMSRILFENNSWVCLADESRFVLHGKKRVKYIFGSGEIDEEIKSDQVVDNIYLEARESTTVNECREYLLILEMRDRMVQMSYNIAVLNSDLQTKGIPKGFLDTNASHIKGGPYLIDQITKGRNGRPIQITLSEIDDASNIITIDALQEKGITDGIRLTYKRTTDTDEYTSLPIIIE